MSTVTVTTTALPAGTWTIDPSHSEVAFTVRHIMSKVRGQFTRFEGALVSDGTPSGVTATGTVDLNSVDTRDEQRDTHLRSKDFFGVEEHGPMTFTSTSYDGTKATGELAIKGVTRTVELDVDVLGTGGDPWGGTRVGIEATTQISRKDYGIDFNIPLDGGKVMIGDTITVLLSVQAVLQADEAPTA